MLDRYVKTRPLAVMTRLILNEVMTDELDAVFHRHRQQGYERELLFSHLAQAISEVVLGFCETPNQAYNKLKEELNVSKTAFYEKLKRVEPEVCRASVQHSYQSCSAMMRQLGFEPWEIVAGYHCKVIDGNHLESCENRLKELRTTWAKALPGTAVVVLDAQRQLAQDIFLIPDGHALERSIFDDILETVQAQDLIVGDSHYCTIKFMASIARQNACFVIRQHGALKGELFGERHFVKQVDTGKVYEQALQIGGECGLKVRRVTIELDEPTENGDTEIHVLSNLPKSAASAQRIAEIYLLRGDVEHLFYLATTTLTCEVKGLNYPQAALFVFCVAMMAINCRQVLMACLVAAYEEEILEEVSHFSIAHEISRSYDGIMVAITDTEWTEVVPKTLAGRIRLMTTAATHFDRKRHRKSVRGSKKPPPKRSPYKNGNHLSIQKLLNSRT